MTLLTIDQVLDEATPEIELLGIITGGLSYARMIVGQLEGRGRVFPIDPHETMGHPGINFKNTLIICDDAIQSGKTMSEVIAHLKQLGYDFETDSCYVAIACTAGYERIDQLFYFKDLGTYYPNAYV